MNIHTNRVKTKKYPESIKGQLLNKSQELFVLALLKYLDSDKYDGVIHSDIVKNTLVLTMYRDIYL